MFVPLISRDACRPNYEARVEVGRPKGRLVPTGASIPNCEKDPKTSIITKSASIVTECIRRMVPCDRDLMHADARSSRVDCSYFDHPRSVTSNHSEWGDLREAFGLGIFLWLGTWLNQTRPRDLPPRFESSGSLFIINKLRSMVRHP